MIIRTIKNKENPYVQINRTICDDERVSYKAMGIHLYLMSKPHGWEAQETDLVKRHADGATAVRSGIAELIEYGYMNRIRVVKENGQIARWRLDVYETPALNSWYKLGRGTEYITEIESDDPVLDKPVLENPKMDIGNHSNKRSIVRKEKEKKDHPRARADTREAPPPTKPERTDDERKVPSDLRVVALREKLHSVGVLITPTIIDSYMAFVEDDLIDFEYILRGITAAAVKKKQHHFKYVAACIRNLASENSPPTSQVNFSIEDIVPELYGDQHGYTG